MTRATMAALDKTLRDLRRAWVIWRCLMAEVVALETGVVLFRPGGSHKFLQNSRNLLRIEFPPFLKSTSVDL